MKNTLIKSFAFMLLAASCWSCNALMRSENGGQRVKVRVAYLEVTEKDKNGEAWDPGGTAATAKPDLFYTISVDYDKKYESEMVGDSFSGRWSEPSKFIEVPPGEKLIFTFYDHDKSIGKSGMLHNPPDPIGEISLTIEEITEAARTKKDYAFDRVIKCRFAAPVVK